MSVSKVAAGQDALAGQYNAVVDFLQDVTSGHAHTGASSGGKKISHTNLEDGAITGLTHSHTAIDAHIGTTAGSGGTGVHDLNALAAVAGVIGLTSATFESGTSYTDVSSGEDPSHVSQKTITFSTAFTSTPIVFMTPVGQTPIYGHYVLSVTTDGFIACFNTGSADTVGYWFYWLALGTVNP